MALPGYVEDGSKDPALDWVTPFEKSTGCQVSSTTASSPAEVTSLMHTGNYDGVSARGDVSLGLVADGLVSPLNTGLIPNYAGLFPAVKQLPPNTVGDAHYGVPIGRFANLLLWRTDEVDMPRTHLFASTSSVLFDPALSSQYRGHVTAYDSPMSIADAALYLRKTDPSLGIDNVYELDREQFDAAIAVLRQQRPNIGRYWRDSGQNVRAFDSGATILGPAWQESINRILRVNIKVKADVPERGRDWDLRQLDDQLPRQAPELHVPVDELHVRGGAERGARRALRTGAGERACVRRDFQGELLRHLSCGR